MTKKNEQVVQVLLHIGREKFSLTGGKDDIFLLAYDMCEEHGIKNRDRITIKEEKGRSLPTYVFTAMK
jgi:hypothetical protein